LRPALSILAVIALPASADAWSTASNQWSGGSSFAPRRSPGSTGRIGRPAPLDRLRPALSILAVIALPASADAWSTASNQWSGGSSFAPRPAPQQTALPGSSFHGVEVRSSFDLAPRSQPPGGKRAPFVMPKGNDELEKVRAVIFHAESRQHGYDAYNLSASIPPPRPASTMTLREIQQWTRDTPGQQHAIGRYQIIPSTLNRLIARTGLALDTVFAPNIQDAFANVLIIDAGYLALKDGSLSLDAFKVELAKVWAGFPLPSGKSYYAGVAGNKATISYRNYSAYMAQIFPVEARKGPAAVRVAANP
jgi:hypothetical protein